MKEKSKYEMPDIEITKFQCNKFVMSGLANEDGDKIYGDLPSGPDVDLELPTGDTDVPPWLK